ncbi:MAG: T9SS type A sorting domain-containing protein [Ignavibacteria bacterium]|nr:T9SS type A sorting domain-containing protein [Ignavibacteria bacterium]
MNSFQTVNYKLCQNYPNPFNSETDIEFEIFKSGNATIKIYNLLGVETTELLNENLKSGRYSIKFKADNFASGIYYYKFSINGYTETKKLLLIK